MSRNPMKPVPMSVGASAVQNAGWLKARKALSFCASWWVAESMLGRPLADVDEYSEWWLESRSTSFRGQQAFRAAFPGFDTPRDLGDAIGYYELLDRKLRKTDQPKIVGQLFSVAMP